MALCFAALFLLVCPPPPRIFSQLNPLAITPPASLRAECFSLSLVDWRTAFLSEQKRTLCTGARPVYVELYLGPCAPLAWRRRRLNGENQTTLLTGVKGISHVINGPLQVDRLPSSRLSWLMVTDLTPPLWRLNWPFYKLRRAMPISTLVPLVVLLLPRGCVW